MRRSTVTSKNLKEQLRMYEAVVLFSGGTDSTVTALLTRQQTEGKILLLTVDTGIGEEERKKAEERASLLQMDHITYDGVDEFCDVYLSQAIMMNANYQDFPLGTPLARSLAFNIALNCMRYSDGDSILAIGSTRCQNTRLRAELTLSNYQGVRVYAPLAEQDLSREDKVNILREYDIPVKMSDNFSTDENLWSRCTESQVLNDLNTNFDPRWFLVTTDLLEASDVPTYVELTFKHGLPVALNGESMKLSRLIQSLNELGKHHAIGRIINIEDTVFGDKIRSIYEAPGASIILTAHRIIENLVFTKHERYLKDSLDRKWAELIYHGNWDGVERISLYSQALPLQYRVNGTLKLQLYKGNITVMGGNVPESLLLVKEIGGLY